MSGPGTFDGRYGNKILVTDELPSGQMVDQWESVVSDTVKTPLEVMSYLWFHYFIIFSNIEKKQFLCRSMSTPTCLGLNGFVVVVVVGL